MASKRSLKVQSAPEDVAEIVSPHARAGRHETEIPMLELQPTCATADQWLRKMFEALNENDALEILRRKLGELSDDLAREKYLNETKTKLAFGHNKPQEIIEADSCSANSVQVHAAAVHVAAAKGWCLLLAELVNRGADWKSGSDIVNSDDRALRQNVTSLHWACAYNRFNVVHLLLTKKRESEFKCVQDNEGYTPLMIAAQFGYLNVTKMLIHHGASVRGTGGDVHSSLLIAARYGHGNIARFLTEVGAEIGDEFLKEIKEAKPSSDLAFNLASKIERNRQVAVPQLSKESLPTLKNGNQMTTSHKEKLPNASEKLSTPVASASNPYLKDSHENTPLHIACLEGDVELVKNHINMGYSVYSMNKSGWVPLHCAVASGKSNVVHAILQGEYDSFENASNTSGDNPLHLTAKLDSPPELIGKLRSLSTYAFSYNNNGDCPIHIAARESSYETFLAILNAFHRLTVDFTNKFGDSALLICIRHGHISKVRMLLDYAADLCPGGPGTLTAMHALADLSSSGDQSAEAVAAIYKLLIDYSANRWFIERGYPCCQPKLTENYREALRSTVFELVCNWTYNGQNVLQYAASRSALSLLSEIVETRDVFHVTENRYNITFLIPECVPKEGERREKRDSRSVLEQIVDGSDDSSSTVKFLEKRPFKELIRPYFRLCYTLQFVMLVIHLSYMSLFTWKTMPSRGVIDDTQSFDTKTWFTDGSQYRLFVVWPLLNFLLDLLYLIVQIRIIQNRTARSKSVKRQLIPILVSLAFCVSTMLWSGLYFHRENRRLYACVLSLVYISGWTYSMTFLRWLKKTMKIVVITTKIVYEDLFPFFIIYVLQLMSFSLAFYVMTAPSSVPDMMIANRTVSYADIFYSSFTLMLGMDSFKDYISIDDDSAYKMFVKFTFVLYESISAIMLLNLLIAMLSHTYEEAIEDVRRELEADLLRMTGCIMWFERKLGCRCGGRSFNFVCGILHFLSNPGRKKSTSESYSLQRPIKESAASISWFIELQ